MEETAGTPGPTETLSTEARDKLLEAAAAVQDASYEELIGKPRRTTEFYVHLQDPESGTMKPRRLKYRAMAPKAFDRLLASHQPTTKQQREGFQWNPDTFPAALIASVSLVPKMTEDQVRELLESENWANGESGALLQNALAVQNAGLDVPFSAGG